MVHRRAGPHPTAERGVRILMKKLLVGIGMLLALSVVLAYFAEVHRPFSQTSNPFVYAFVGVFMTLVVFIFIVRYFVRM